MNTTEPESDLFLSVPESEPVDDVEVFDPSDGEDTEESEDFSEENDGQPDWAQEWHDFDPDC